MELSFIDIENGQLFDGKSPYVHWFDEGQSNNIIYVKKIMFLCDQSNVTVSIENNTIFTLVDIQALLSTSETTINDFSYRDINSSGVKVTSLTSTGTAYNGKFLHIVYVLAQSEDEGEFICDLLIGNEKTHIGADFYNENEILVSNLENFGIEIPQQIQKAIYESNIREEAMDNILMNRKWKELLLEYWNIVAKKGSYKSLVSSLGWFEYGGLVKIMEYWKAHYNKDIYISNDIEKILNDRFRKQLSVLSKTTYIGLYFALEKVSVDSETNFVIYDDDTPVTSGILPENNPTLEKVSTLWNSIDLALKMSLLGSFYSAYFMPLHLDLIHSTIENIVFTNTIKIYNYGNIYINFYSDLANNFLSSVKDNSNYYISPIDVYVSPRTVLGFKDYIVTHDEDNPTSESHNSAKMVTKDKISMVGVDLEPNYEEFGDSDAPWQDLILTGLNTISMFGALVPIDVKIIDNVDPSDWLKSAQIHWVRNGSSTFDYTDNGIYISPTPVYDEDNNVVGHKYEFDFHLAFENPGSYRIFITFESANSFVYSREFNINILDDIDCTIHMYKVNRIDMDKIKDYQIKYTQSDGHYLLYVTDPANEGREFEINNFAASHLRESLPYSGRQYIIGSTENFSEAVGLNHVIQFCPYLCDSSATLIGNSTVSASSATVSSLESAFPDYWWFSRVAPISISRNTPINDTDNRTGEYTVGTIITGIRKKYTVDKKYRKLFYKEYKKGLNESPTYTFEITQIGMRATLSVSRNSNVLYFSSQPLKNQYSIIVDNVLFEATVYPDWNWKEYENSDLSSNKIKLEGNFKRIVDEDRFIPWFHTLEKVNEKNCEVKPSELFVAIPEFARTYGEPTDMVWDFLNSSIPKHLTMIDGKYAKMPEEDSDVFFEMYKGSAPVDGAEPVISYFEPRKLEKGYYNIVLRYNYAGEDHYESRNAAFKVIE